MALGALLFQPRGGKNIWMQYFNIQVASQLSGVASATIRAWEKRYNAVVPERAENKHRLYSEKDIEKLALLFRLTEFGQSIGKIAHLDLDHLKQIYSTLMHRPYDEKKLITPHQDKVDYPKVLTNIHLALSAFKLDIISHELTKAREVLSPRELCLELLVPLLKETRNRVTRHELNLTQEHALKELVHTHIGEIVVRHLQESPQRLENFLLLGGPLPSLLCSHYSLTFMHLGEKLAAATVAESAHALKSKAIIIDPSFEDESFIRELQQQLLGGTELWRSEDLHQLDRLMAQRQKSFNEIELPH